MNDSCCWCFVRVITSNIYLGAWKHSFFFILFLETLFCGETENFPKKKKNIQKHMQTTNTDGMTTTIFQQTTSFGISVCHFEGINTFDMALWMSYLKVVFTCCFQKYLFQFSLSHLFSPHHLWKNFCQNRCKIEIYIKFLLKICLNMWQHFFLLRSLLQKTCFSFYILFYFGFSTKKNFFPS